MFGTPGAALVGGAVVASGVSLLLAWYAWRRRARPGAAAFAGVMAVNALWIATHAASLVSAPGAAGRWFLASKSIVVFAPVAWVTFAFTYAGFARRRVRRLTAVAGLPALALAGLIATNPLHGLVYRSVDATAALGVTVPVPGYGIGALVVLGYAAALLVAGFAVLMNYLLTHPEVRDIPVIQHTLPERDPVRVVGVSAALGTVFYLLVVAGASGAVLVVP